MRAGAGKCFGEASAEGPLWSFLLVLRWINEVFGVLFDLAGYESTYKCTYTRKI